VAGRNSHSAADDEHEYTHQHSKLAGGVRCLFVVAASAPAFSVLQTIQNLQQLREVCAVQHSGSYPKEDADGVEVHVVRLARQQQQQQQAVGRRSTRRWRPC
jgi:hypothetical protein